MYEITLDYKCFSCSGFEPTMWLYLIKLINIMYKITSEYKRFSDQGLNQQYYFIWSKWPKTYDTTYTRN